MSQHGELPRLDAVFFADTMAEPQGVYDTIEWVSAAIDIPLHRVSAGNLRQDILAAAQQHTAGARVEAGHSGQPPFYVKHDPHKDSATAGSGGVLWRKCTADYKIKPIRRKLRQLLGLSRTGRVRALHVEQWIGFSLDDIGRTFCSDVQWITNIFPLILPKRMRRRDCIAWLHKHGYPIPMKSSCLFCPYHSNTYWRDMRDTRPDEWHHTVEFERQLQAGRLPGVRGIPYLHKSMVPLPLAPIDEPETGQQDLFCFACHT
jgi:hypothetical protein